MAALFKGSDIVAETIANIFRGPFNLLGQFCLPRGRKPGTLQVEDKSFSVFTQRPIGRIPLCRVKLLNRPSKRSSFYSFETPSLWIDKNLLGI